MNTRQMDCVLELSQTLNFNRAAENLFMSQPALSYQVKTLEEEVGFKLFDRSGRGAALTPAGAQFCTSLRTIRDDIKRAVELGQNFSERYSVSLRIGLPQRSALKTLPNVIRRMAKLHPDVSITPAFDPTGSPDAFLRGEQDVLFAQAHDLRRASQIATHPLYESRIYLITRRDDPLASKDLVTSEDLRQRTLMVGGGSPPELKAVQHRVLAELNLAHFNSADHETTLVNVEAGRGVCLAPGFLNDDNGEFAWTPFDCAETIPCVLCTHAEDHRASVADLVKLLQGSYQNVKRV